MKTKVRIAYGYSKKTGELIVTENTVNEAIKVNMLVTDYEEQLKKSNPQLEWEFKIETWQI